MLVQVLHEPLHDAAAVVVLYIVVSEYVDKSGAGRNQAKDRIEWENAITMDKSRQVITTSITKGQDINLFKGNKG